MAQEHAALKTLAAKKDRSVPVYVLLWTSFRCKVDNDCKKGSGPFFEYQGDHLKRLMNASLKKSAPKGFCELTHTAQSRRTKEGIPLFLFFHRLVVQSPIFCVRETGGKRGFGVYARRKITFAEACEALVGWLAPISEEDYDQLNRASHPSLYQVGRERFFVLIGPISIANHDCHARAGFSRPKPISQTNVPDFAKDYGDRLIPEDLKPLQLMLRDLTVDGHPGFEQDEEIVVQYGLEMFDNCACCSCVGKPPRKRHSSRKLP